MTEKHIKIGHMQLSLTDVIVIKVALSVALIAVFFIPSPWNIPVGISANMIWIWRL